MKTLRRNKIRNDIAKGLLEAKCEYHFTDDYAFDNASDFGKTKWMDVKVIEDGDSFESGKINFHESDFKTKSGTAYKTDDGSIRLIVHSNLSFTLRYKKAS